jgi:hypothetical protein
MSFDPDRTLPIIPRGATTPGSAREYTVESCPACYNIAERRGVVIGQVHSIFGFGQGPVEAVACTRGRTVVLMRTPDMPVWVDLEEVAAS